MTTSDWIWAGLILLGAAYEVYTLRTGNWPGTLTGTTRSFFRTRTSRAGRWVFLTAWGVFALWFTGHVLDWWE